MTRSPTIEERQWEVDRAQMLYDDAYRNLALAQERLDRARKEARS